MRIRLTKRRLFWVAIVVCVAATLGVSLVAWERARQRKILAQAQVSLWVDDAWRHPVHTPVVKSLNAFGFSLDFVMQAEWWLELFADGYSIGNTDCSSPKSNRELPHLQGWPARKARHFGIWFPEFSDSDFEMIGTMPQLKKLVLTRGQITDEIIPLIARQAPGLESLYLDSRSIHGAHLEQIQFLKAAVDPKTDFSLTLESTSIDDDGFAELAQYGSGITGLTIRGIEGISLSDAMIESIAKLAALERLEIGAPANRDAELNFSPLANLVNLKSLTINGWPRQSALSLLKTRMHGLKNLDLAHVPLSAGEIDRIPSFAPHLTHLGLSSTGIGSESLAHLLPLKTLKNLSIANNPRIDVEAEEILLRFPPSMETNLIQTQLDPKFDPDFHPGFSTAIAPTSDSPPETPDPFGGDDLSDPFGGGTESNGATSDDPFGP